MGVLTKIIIFVLFMLILLYFLPLMKINWKEGKPACDLLNSCLNTCVGIIGLKTCTQEKVDDCSFCEAKCLGVIIDSCPEPYK